MTVSRPEVLQGILDLFEAPHYLEVGVAKGRTFNAARAHRKVAVDPAFLFNVAVAERGNPRNSYHQITSDEYFGSVVGEDERFDVIYLDGLHTSEQTLRDLLNAILHLSEHGVIVIDDAVPGSYAASLPDEEESRGAREALSMTSKAWMGDIYRLVFFIESFMQAFDYRVTEDNHGQIVLWRARRNALPTRTIEAVGRLEYKCVFQERGAFRFAPYAAILEVLRSRKIADRAAEPAEPAVSS